MKTNPKISVVMPFYNHSHLVANAINSIRNQTFEDWELIIINDGSDYNHEDVLNKVVKKFSDTRIKVRHIPHSGLVKARNRGCDIAQGDIIATQDADDLSMPDRLEKCLNEMEIGNWDIVCHGAYINMWDLQVNAVGRRFLSAGNIENILQGQSLTAWPLFKKIVWEKKPFRIETQYSYDWMMWLDWIYSDFKIHPINEGLYEYVRHENSASIRFERKGLRRQSIQKIREIMKQEYDVSIDSHVE